MSKLLRSAVESRRLYLINKLIKIGLYKKDESHLYELTLTDLEKEYSKQQSIKKPIR